MIARGTPGLWLYNFVGPYIGPGGAHSIGGIEQGTAAEALKGAAGRIPQLVAEGRTPVELQIRASGSDWITVYGIQRQGRGYVLINRGQTRARRNPERVTLPKYRAERFGWTAGDRRRLYTFVDPRTGAMSVRPGGRTIDQAGGPVQTVRPATRAEAEKLWQSPLHPGWKVIEP